MAPSKASDASACGSCKVRPRQVKLGILRRATHPHALSLGAKRDARSQVLRYETGQFYKVHHDQNSPRSSAWGPRMFTVFMYVGDGYEGGLTDFPRLNVTVPAKKGAVCVWTSVLDTDPYQRDDRTDHESLPVESGVKFGVNYWIHMYPFRTMVRAPACDMPHAM